VNPVYPRMFASGTFVNSFPKTDSQSQCTLHAIKAFKANVVIVVDDTYQQIILQQKLKEDVQFMRENDTIIVFLNKPQGVNAGRQTDCYSLYQEYFLGKNCELLAHKELYMFKIKQIKIDSEQQAYASNSLRDERTLA